MATLLVAAAVNIAIGLAINALFPPPDIEQEGPRLSDLNFTSAAYGKFVNIPFGTDRMGGNLIDTTDPAIEEVVNESSESVGKGGGQEVNTTTYTYFLTGRIAFCIEGATDLIRLWGDGKTVFDATATTQLVKEGWTVQFYPGGPDQAQDAEEVSRRDANIPAYRHLTTVKLDRCALADFGNRIPNFTAEISFNSTVSSPVIFLAPEPTSFNPPGALTGADTTYMSLNPTRNQVYGLKSASGGVWAADATSLDFQNFIGGGGFAQPYVGLDTFAYEQVGGANSEPVLKKDVDTGTTVASLGTSGIQLTDSLNGGPPNEPTFGNIGRWYQLNSTVPGVGVFSTIFHMNTEFPAGGPPNGAVVDADNMVAYHIMSTSDGLVDDGGPLTGLGIPDHDRGRFFIFQDDSLNDEYRLVEYIPSPTIGLGGVSQTGVTTRLVRRFTRGSSSSDFPAGTGVPAGWAVNRNTGDLILSNASSLVLYNPDTDTILAQRVGAAGFVHQNNYYTSSLIGWMNGSTTPSASSLTIIDTRTLETIRSFVPITSAAPDLDDNVIHEHSQVWDDRLSAIIFSRVEAGSGASADERVAKLFVNRIQANGVLLSDVVTALSTSYQRQTMAGLTAADIDVSELTGDTVEGYTINRKSTMRSALEPLRMRYQFDAIQSDWIMKFPKRGQSPIFTIPEEEVGMLKRGRDQNDEPPIQEIRQDDLSLPMRLALRYKNKDADYQIDMEHDKRHLFPNPTMRSKTELTLDVPLVDTATNMKQLAQKQLLTTWSERVSYKTVIPWTYIKLDPTDVFNLGAFGETARLRMVENDLGQGWAIEVTGVVEDVAQYSSTLAGGQNLGHIAPNLPSGLPTVVVPMDAPILASEDLLLTPISNAYMAVRAFESTWPGASVQKSVDNVNYINTGSVNQECVFAKVDVAPSPWAFQEGTEFRNRFQEVADGGTMTVTSIRRTDWWASATELDVLNGWNHIAVIGSDGEVEIIGFVDVTDNNDGTFTLSRLLRGRLGTEDVADGNLAAGDTVIGLINNMGVREIAPITRQRLSLSDLDTELFFRGVTIGTPSSDAPVVSFTYTGRDLKPYFPADIIAEPDGSGGLDVTWQRRTRGPSAGEWLDGIGTVPLNETIEQYEVTLNNGVDDFITKVVNDTNTVNFTQAEVEGGGGSGGAPKQPWPTGTAVLGDFDTSTNLNVLDQPLVDGGWVNIDGPTGWYWQTSHDGIVLPTDSRIVPASTAMLHYHNNSSDAQRTIRNTIHMIDDLGLAGSEIPFATINASIWLAQPDGDDSADFWLRVLDIDDNILATTSLGGIQAGPSSGVNFGDWINVGSIYDATSDPWPQRNLTIQTNQPGAVKLAFDIGINKFGTTFNNGLMSWDHLEVEAIVTPAVTVKVVQVSESGKKSPIAIKEFGNT